MHVMVAGYLGIKSSGGSSPGQEASPDQAAKLMDMFPVQQMPKIMTPEEYLARRNKHGE